MCVCATRATSNVCATRGGRTEGDKIIIKRKKNVITAEPGVYRKQFVSCGGGKRGVGYHFPYLDVVPFFERRFPCRLLFDFTFSRKFAKVRWRDGSKNGKRRRKNAHPFFWGWGFAGRLSWVRLTGCLCVCVCVSKRLDGTKRIGTVIGSYRLRQFSFA